MMSSMSLFSVWFSIFSNASLSSSSFFFSSSILRSTSACWEQTHSHLPFLKKTKWLSVEKDGKIWPSHHFLVQSCYHLFQFLVSFFEVLLCSLQGIQFGLSSVHLLLHSPAKLVTHGWNQGCADGVLANGAISARAFTKMMIKWGMREWISIYHKRTSVTAPLKQTAHTSV